jgi:thiamine pyrophosphate-dependent acetolactate synthase large subunit-like protein
MTDVFLNVGRRTGVRDDEIEEFVSKVDSVQQAIAALAAGREVDVNLPEDLAHVLETPDQQARRAERDRQRREEYEQRERARKKAQAKEEHERWWNGARNVKAMNNENEVQEQREDGEGEPKATQYSQQLDKYTVNYSKVLLCILLPDTTMHLQ